MSLVNALGQSPEEVWAASLAMKSGITTVPPSRWDHGLYYDPHPFVPDKTYCKVGAFTDLQISRTELGISPHDFRTMTESTRITMWLADQAIRISGLLSSDIPRERIGVLISQNSGEAAGSLAGIIIRANICHILADIKRAVPLTPDQESAIAQEMKSGRLAPDDTTLLGRLNCAAVMARARWKAREDANRVAVALGIPMIYARKARPITMPDRVFEEKAPSHTKGRMVELIVSPEYLASGERVLIIDDFLASGATILGLVRLAQAAGSTVVGVGTLIEKARKGFFGKLLDDQIPFRARVLECGCGTGQLTNFLSIANRDVIGTDICLNSLKMAHDFKRKNSLDRAVFFQMNLFRPCFRPESFDLVICNGVLHHTSDPFLGFKSISALVKQGGYILIGLYHRYGRLVTDMRRVVFRITGDRLKFLDRRAVNEAISLPKRISWFKDQYKNPHESKHTFGEVKEWFDRTDFEFIQCIPKTVPFVGFTESERLFHPDRFGSPIERLLVNIGTVFTGSREGGFFVMIGKRSH